MASSGNASRGSSGQWSKRFSTSQSPGTSAAISPGQDHALPSSYITNATCTWKAAGVVATIAFCSCADRSHVSRPMRATRTVVLSRSAALLTQPGVSRPSRRHRGYACPRTCWSSQRCRAEPAASETETESSRGRASSGPVGNVRLVAGRLEPECLFQIGRHRRYPFVKRLRRIVRQSVRNPGCAAAQQPMGCGV